MIAKELTKAELDAFSARLKDRSWAVIVFTSDAPDAKGTAFRLALDAKLADYVGPVFLVGKDCRGEGVFMENYDANKLNLWLALTRSHVFLTNKGYMADDSDVEVADPLNFDHLHVGNLFDKRFTHGYFVVALDAKIIPMKDGDGDEMTGVGAAKLVCFGVPGMNISKDKPNCRFCGDNDS